MPWVVWADWVADPPPSLPSVCLSLLCLSNPKWPTDLPLLFHGAALPHVSPTNPVILVRLRSKELLLRSLRLLLALPAELVLPLSNRLASGLLILIQVMRKRLIVAPACRNRPQPIAFSRIPCPLSKGTAIPSSRQANASALSALSTAGQWEVIGALMSMAVAADGGRGFVLEALTFMVKRGLGLLGR